MWWHDLLSLVTERNSGTLLSIATESIHKQAYGPDSGHGALILKTLDMEPMNGWMVSQRLKKFSGDVPQIGNGLTLPRSQVLVESSGGRMRFYSIRVTR